MSGEGLLWVTRWRHPGRTLAVAHSVRDLWPSLEVLDWALANVNQSCDYPGYRENQADKIKLCKKKLRARIFFVCHLLRAWLFWIRRWYAWKSKGNWGPEIGKGSTFFEIFRNYVKSMRCDAINTGPPPLPRGVDCWWLLEKQQMSLP